MYSFSYLEPVCCSMSSCNCCFLICIQVSQEAGHVVWNSHLFQNCPQFIVIHTVKGFGIVNKAEIDIFLELSCFWLKWTGMSEFNSDDHYIYYWVQKSHRRNGVAIIVNKSIRNAVPGCNLKNDRMISVRFQGKPFNIMVIQVYAWTRRGIRSWRSWSWTVLWRPTRPFRTNTPKRCPFHYRGLEYKSRKSRNTWGNRQIWPWSTEWSRAKANRTRECTGHSKHPLPTTQDKTLHMDISR